MTNLNLADTKWLHRPLWELTRKKDQRKVANETHVLRTGDNLAIIYKDQRLALIGIRSVTLLGQRRTPDPVAFRLNKVLRDHGITPYTASTNRYNPSTLYWNDGTYHQQRFSSATFELQQEGWVMTEVVAPAA